MFGMKENNEFVDLYTVLCSFMGVFDLSAVISTVSHLLPVTVSSVVQHRLPYFRATCISV
jgi:hypothetical protein